MRDEKNIDAKLHALVCAASMAMDYGATREEVIEAFTFGLADGTLGQLVDATGDPDAHATRRAAWNEYETARDARRSHGDYASRYFPSLLTPEAAHGRHARVAA